MADILIIEDDADLRSMLRQALEKANYKVIEAADGEEGCRLFREHPTKVVITDIFMPKKDGLQAIQSIRADAPQTAIIATTGGNKSMGTTAWLPIVTNLGASYVLKKPFKITTLLDHLEEIFRRKQQNDWI